MLNELFLKFDSLKTIAQTSEGWGGISFKGTWNETSAFNFSDLYEIINSDNLNLAFSCKIDGNTIDFETFQQDLFDGSSWEFNINKISRILENKYNFFYFIEEFKKWSLSLSCFDSNNPIIKNELLQIIVNELKEKDFIVANNYTICGPFGIRKFIETSDIPEFEKISTNVHIATRENFILEPKKLFIESGNYSQITAPFFEMCAKSLAVCLVSEIVNENQIILRGIRKIELPISTTKTIFDLNQLQQLKSVIKWIYEEKTDLKIKLFLDRFTLDLDLSKDYISELLKLNKTCYEQARERFSFITFERKDQFQKELRDLLKDLKNLSDLYTTKVRSLLSNLLRDVLAGLILIGITILSKVDLNSISSANSIIDLVFKAFAAYFVISIAYQSIFDLIDIRKTKRELIFWKKTSREYISDREFDSYLQSTVGERERFTYSFYILLIVSYLGLAYVSFNFISLIQNFIK